MQWTFPNQWYLRSSRAKFLAYGGSVLGVSLATVVLLVASRLQALSSVPFTAVVVFAAWFGGRGPAILATMLSAMALDYFFLPPAGSFSTSITATLCVVCFTFVGWLICYLNESNQRIAAELREACCATRSALNEKELLLRELQHRVKNNFQIVNSLLSLQSTRLPEPTSLKAFKECQHRVRAIALVHDRLYRAVNLAQLDVEAYLRDLVQNLLLCYRADRSAVTSRVVVDGSVVKIDHLIPCALIVNELVSNALKYAFPDGRAGEVRVELHKQNGNVILRVADDGIGFAPCATAPSNGIGQQIVNALVNQLSGKLEWTKGPGASALITFAEAN